MRFILGIVIAVMVACPAAAETNSTNFKIQNGKIILAQMQCNCTGENISCRSRCPGSGTQCIAACDAAQRECVKRCN